MKWEREELGRDGERMGNREKGGGSEGLNCRTV